MCPTPPEAALRHMVAVTPCADGIACARGPALGTSHVGGIGGRAETAAGSTDYPDPAPSGPIKMRAAGCTLQAPV